MRHADYRTTLNHYTMLSLADTSAAMRLLPDGGGTRMEQSVVLETTAREPQQISQQSAHDEAPDEATPRDELAGWRLPSPYRTVERNRPGARRRDKLRRRAPCVGVLAGTEKLA